MKPFLSTYITLLSATTALVGADVTFTNFIRQVQFPTGVQRDVSVAEVSPADGSLSELAIDPGGARFELWTVKSSPLTSYLLDTKYVGAYIPMTTVVIRSEDPYELIPRTRADRPFYVDITTAGLLNGATDPLPSKSVKLLRHVQSYGVGGTGVIINRSQATLLSQATISANGSQTLTYAVTSVPGADRVKVRGEERFSIFSVADYQAPESQLASMFVQIWPVADGSIAGITQDQFLRFEMPPLTFTLNDLYPSSRTYAQVYPGNPKLGTTGTVVPGSSLVLNEAIPQSRVLTANNYGDVLNVTGRWTMELLTVTPFGIDRLAYVSFDINRTIKVIGSTTTVE